MLSGCPSVNTVRASVRPGVRPGSTSYKPMYGTTDDVVEGTDELIRL